MATAGDSPVPIVDYGRFLHGSAAERQHVASQIDEAFRGAGFVFLLNHGIAPAKVAQCFEWVRPSPPQRKNKNSPPQPPPRALVSNPLRPPHQHQAPRAAPAERRAPPRLLARVTGESKPE